ncbi:MAG: FAD-binding protein [Desulfobacterales bacterium]|nr:FAD-binding protein [Desulfobacterales bacterium]
MTDKKKPEIWVFGDLRNNRLFDLCLHVLAKARGLARSLSGQVVLVLIGPPGRDDSHPAADTPRCFNVLSAQKTAVAHGADRVFFFHHKDFGTPRADIFSAVLAREVAHRRPRLVLFALSDFGRELAARTARLANAGLIADCMELRVAGDRIHAYCPSWAGEITAEITFSDPLKTGFATVQPHGIKIEEVTGRPGRVQSIPVEYPAVPGGLTLISSSTEPEEHRKLEEALVVVVGGAGLGSAEDFAKVRHLAAAVDGEVGATRPPVLLHWVEEQRLIGQTGKVVRPGLLFSIGTSGAIQYTAGIMEAKTIVAINRDPDASIFQVADLGVVADAKTFLPLLTAKAKQTVMRKLADVLCEDGIEGPKSGFGAKIEKLRKSHDWSIETLAQKTGQSPEFIQQVEKEAVSPSVSFLLQLSAALDVAPDTFLLKEEKTRIRDQRVQAFVKRTQNYSYEILTPGAETSHLRAFMVTIESKQVHKPVAYKHEGEEFVFVMGGELELTLDSKPHHLKTGECHHFNSDIPHKLKSLSNEPTRCLVVLYTL